MLIELNIAKKRFGSVEKKNHKDATTLSNSLMGDFTLLCGCGSFLVGICKFEPDIYPWSKKGPYHKIRQIIRLEHLSDSRVEHKENGVSTFE